MRARDSLRRTVAVILKEYKHIWQDPGFFFLTVLSPAVLLTLLTYIFSFNIQSADMAVINQDRSPQSFEYIRALTANGDLTISEAIQSYDEAVKMLKGSRVDAVLVIPPGFGDKLSAGESSPVNLVVDASDPSTASQVIGAIEQRTQIYSQSMSDSTRVPFDVRMRVWFNANLDSQYSMVPGLMAIVLILPAMAVALGITREKESGTFETLSTTPIQGPEYRIGKLAVYLSLGLVGTLLALGIAVYWFHVPFRGNLGLYILLTADYLFATMGFCLVVAHFTPSQRTATSVILLTLFIPSFFLTGLLLPLDESSFANQLTSFGLPGTHFIIISRGVALKALSITSLWPEALTLAMMGLIAVIASIRLFTKKIYRGRLL